MKNCLLTLLSLLVTSVAVATVPADSDPTTETVSAPIITYEFYSEDVVIVTIENTDEPGARLYYQVNGDNWQEYTGPFDVYGFGHFIVEAYASVDGKMDSNISAVEFYIQEPPIIEETIAPTICYEYGVPYSSVTVTIFNEDPNEAELYYRCFIYDSGDVSEWMTYDGPFVISSPGQYRVEAYACALDRIPSQVVAVDFYVYEPEPPQPTEKAEAPTMAYEYTNYLPPVVTVTVCPSEEYSELYYRYLFDEGEMSEWMDYTAPIYFSEKGNYIVEAYAEVPGKLPSEMVGIMFSVMDPPQADKPVIIATSNEDGTVDVSIMYNEGHDQTIYYRIDGGDWYVYDGIPIRFTEPGVYTITAYAVEENMLPSVEVSMTFLVTEVAPYDFVENGIYYKITGGDKVKVTFESTYYNSYSGMVNIPKTVTHDGVTYLVTAIGDNAFKNCTALTGVTIGGYVTSIGEAAFSRCTALTSVEIGNYVITLADDAFYYCDALTTVTLGSGVRSIGNRVFAGCYSLETFNCKPAVSPTVGNACFSNATLDNAILNVYPAVLDSYREANVWKLFEHIQGSEGVDPAVGDVDGDGEIGISDVSSLIDLLLNL